MRRNPAFCTSDFWQLENPLLKESAESFFAKQSGFHGVREAVGPPPELARSYETHLHPPVHGCQSRARCVLQWNNDVRPLHPLRKGMKTDVRPSALLREPRADRFLQRCDSWILHQMNSRNRAAKMDSTSILRGSMTSGFHDLPPGDGIPNPEKYQTFQKLNGATSFLKIFLCAFSQASHRSETSKHSLRLGKVMNTAPQGKSEH